MPEPRRHPIAGSRELCPNSASAFLLMAENVMAAGSTRSSMSGIMGLVICENAAEQRRAGPPNAERTFIKNPCFGGRADLRPGIAAWEATE